MKKKKVIIGSCVITVALVATLGSVFVLGSSDNENKNKNNETVVENNETTENVVDNEFIEDNTDGYKVETESGKIEETDYTAMAIAKYKEIGSQLTIPEDTYVSEYLELIKNGSTPEKAEEHLFEHYRANVEVEEETTSSNTTDTGNSGNTSSGNSSEQSTEKPTEKPTKPKPVDPFTIEPSGKHKDSKTQVDGIYTFYLRTFDNGAQRYVVHAKCEDIIDKYFYIRDDGIIPESVLNEVFDAFSEHYGEPETTKPAEKPSEKPSVKEEQTSSSEETTALGDWDDEGWEFEESPSDWYEEIEGDIKTN